MECFDWVVIGAGMYGLYAASKLTQKGHRVAVIDIEKEPFSRGSYINQARLHNGYHYPRSFSTAHKSAKYFNRFMQDFGDCVNDSFLQVYATSKEYSWTNGNQFKKFCKNVDVPCEGIEFERFFNPNTIDGAFVTKEYSFDAMLLKNKLFTCAKNNSCHFLLGSYIKGIQQSAECFTITLSTGEEIKGTGVINATYAGTNQIHQMLGYELLPIKYELCEVILCQVTDNIKEVGLTVMDGPFFSLMPFGKTGYHSITAVSRTPHDTSYEAFPTFSCQLNKNGCTPMHTDNCNRCLNAPQSAFTEMRQIARKYLREDIDMWAKQSLFTLKPILRASEIDDSRPTLVRQYHSHPDFFTVFSGKINTMYDLDEIL